MTEQDFTLRLTSLRRQKGVSAREMSLSIGQNEGYINNIESGKSLPSMYGFFYICEYFKISPRDFFDEELESPSKANELYMTAKHIKPEKLDHLISIAKSLAEK